MINTLPQSLIETAKKILSEMAAPSKEIKEKTFYHGTYSDDGSDGLMHAANIAKHGIVPRSNLDSYKDEKERALTPVSGHSYATHDLGYSQIYAIGGDYAGHDFSKSNWRPNHKYGYVFSFKGKKLSDIQPDEDVVGKMYYNAHSSHHKGLHNGVKVPSFINDLATKHATPYTRKKAKEGEYDHWAKLGKAIIPHMTDEQKLEVISNHSPHVANRGTIVPDRVYRIATDKIPMLKKDASNFFDHAEELDMEKLKEGQAVVRRKRKPL